MWVNDLKSKSDRFLIWLLKVDFIFIQRYFCLLIFCHRLTLTIGTDLHWLFPLTYTAYCHRLTLTKNNHRVSEDTEGWNCIDLILYDQQDCKHLYPARSLREWWFLMDSRYSRPGGTGMTVFFSLWKSVAFICLDFKIIFHILTFV